MVVKPPKQQNFVQVYEDLSKAIDVDDSVGRSVPTNMNFTDDGFLIKDTGFVLYGASTAQKRHSLFHYKKKDGTSFKISVLGTKLQRYNEADREWADISGSPTFTENKEMGYVVYLDLLYMGNGTESMYTFDGTTFTEYASAPKGNIFEVFEDRVFVTGVTAEPLSAYYSNVSIGTSFDAASVIKPLGTDSITSLRNFYGTLLIFKTNSIWKLTFTYDQVVSLFVPKLESQSGNYGACSRKATAWVENDIWFFTGREVKSIGLLSTASGVASGVLGVNKSDISNNIKETLKLISQANFSNCICAYDNRRFYLGVPVTASTVDTVFVCHLLYGRSWTKYSGRTKSRVNDFMFIDNVTYTTASSSPYGAIKWKIDTTDTQDINYELTTES